MMSFICSCRNKKFVFRIMIMSSCLSFICSCRNKNQPKAIHLNMMMMDHPTSSSHTISARPSKQPDDDVFYSSSSGCLEGLALVV
jgi:hypothetical protein